MASYEPAAPAPDAELIYLPPQHNELYPTFADFVQRLGYLRFARDLDVVNSNNPSGFLIYESVTVNAWIYKLCIAYKQWDGKWFQTGFTITNNNHKKRILKDAILQFQGSQAMDVERYWTIKCNVLGDHGLRNKVEITWTEPLKEIFPDEFAKATRYNLQLTRESWKFIMEED